MNIFNPHTYSTDWEIMVVDKLDRCVSDQKLAGFAGLLRAEFGLPIQIDCFALELALGINSSFSEFWDRTVKVTDRASQLLREYDLDMFPAGAHPVQPIFCASHIHIGSIHDEAIAVHLENRMMQYLPVFAALAANSPFASGRRSEYKSYRVKDKAHWCIEPMDVRDPGMAQTTWNRDIAPKICSAPTIEVRIEDCASSRRLLAEFATFTAAYVHYKGEDMDEYRPTHEEYKEYLTNRWAAARYGLQATFSWHGVPRPVVELLDEMLDECKTQLETLGVKRSELVILNKMIEKRVCQADFALRLADRYADRYCLASAYGKLVRQWDAFETYLETAETLDPIPALSDDDMLAEHLEFIGEGTHYYCLREAISYPAPATNELIERMVAEHLVRREITSNCGTLLYRIG